MMIAHMHPPQSHAIQHVPCRQRWTDGSAAVQVLHDSPLPQPDALVALWGVVKV